MTVEKQKAELESLWRAIGHFVFEFSQLEHVIRSSLADALQIDDNEQFYIVLPSIDFAQLCNVTKAIYLRTIKMGAEDQKRIEKILSQCLRINDERVSIVHGTWFKSDDGGGALHVKRTTRQRDIKYKDIEDIESLTKQVEELKKDLAVFITGKLRFSSAQ